MHHKNKSSNSNVTPKDNVVYFSSKIDKIEQEARRKSIKRLLDYARKFDWGVN